MAEEEPLSDNPEENLRLENELMKIKLKAQFGEGFQMENNEDLPPEVENEFLKNMMAFEEQFSEANMVTVFEKIGKPPFVPLINLDKRNLQKAIKKLSALLEKHEIILHYNYGPYSDEIIYKFITEDIFSLDVPKSSVAGLTQNFIYEEFHPNHKSEILKNTHSFLSSWFTRDISITSAELSWHCVNAAGTKFTREDLTQRIKNFFDSFEMFENDGYNINDIQWEPATETQAGMGFTEGVCKYSAVMENREVLHFEGPYKLYFEQEENWWSIFYFVIPGFNW